MVESLKQGTPDLIETISFSDNGGSKQVEEVVAELKEQVNSGGLKPEDGIRAIWRRFLIGGLRERLTKDQRVRALDGLLNSFSEEVLGELNRPVGLEGRTRLMQIAVEEVANAGAQLRKSSQESTKRPSGGMRKHIRNEKAKARR